MPKGIKSKYSHSEGEGTSPSIYNEDSGFEEDSRDNRSSIDDEIDYDDEWETVSIPYTKLPSADIFPVSVNASEIDDKAGLYTNSSTNKYFLSVDVNSGMNDTTKTLNDQFKAKRNVMGYDGRDSTTGTCSSFTTLQKFSVFRSLHDNNEEDGQSNTTASPSWEVLDHVFVRGPFSNEGPSTHQVGTQQNNTSEHQESLSSTDDGGSSSTTQPVPKRNVRKAKKRRSETRVKGLYSDIPLQSFVTQQFRNKKPYLNLSPRTLVQVETLLSDMVGRIADEAKNLVALSSKKRVDSRVLKYAIKLMLEHMKKEGDVAAGRSSAWLF